MEIRLHLRDIGDRESSARRLRAALKRLLRTHGFQATRIEGAANGDARQGGARQTDVQGTRVQASGVRPGDRAL